jgi:hypothetical protein
MGCSRLSAAWRSQAVGNRPNVVVVLDLEQFCSIIVVGLNQKVAAGKRPTQSNPAIGGQDYAFWPLESDA